MNARKGILASMVVIALGYCNGARAGSVYSNAVLADSPVAYYQMNEPSGTTAVDAIAAQNGTYSGGVTMGNPGPQPPAFVGFNPPPTNTAATFDGVDGKLETGTAITTLGTSYSMEIWFNYAVNTGLFEYIVGRYVSGSDQGDSIFASGSTLYYYPGSGGITGGVTYEAGWNDLVLTHTGSTVDIYLNGNTTPIITATSTDPYGSSNDIVAGIRGDDALPFEGSLDELSVYNTVLTPTQIAVHYGAAFTIPEPASLGLLAVGCLGLLKRRRA